MMKFISLLIFAYIIGSVPIGIIIAKFKNIELDKVGSGSVGSTNVTRALGKRYGYIVFALDSIKALFVGLIANMFLGNENTYQVLIILFIVLIGNSYSIFLKFKGGKGVATSFGIIVYLNWQISLICLVIWILAFKKTKTVSTAGLIAIPFGSIFLALTNNMLEAILGLVVYIFIVYRHKENISRIIKGKENSF
jgi:glycerol-3-phosphate acyltransferase PlsY